MRRFYHIPRYSASHNDEVVVQILQDNVNDYGVVFDEGRLERVRDLLAEESQSGVPLLDKRRALLVSQDERQLDDDIIDCCLKWMSGLP